MAWTYGGDPSANTRDAVRFLVGDTDTADQLASDEEIAWSITAAGSRVYGAAALVARAIAGRFARKVSTSVDGVSQQLQQKHAQYLAMADRYDAMAAKGAAGLLPRPFVGGGAATAAAGPDTIFSIGMDDHPGVAYSDLLSPDES